MIELLAVLSASAAVGMRIALPMLVIGLFQGNNLWSQMPILSKLSSPILLFFLSSWSLVELFASKQMIGQRVLQVVELILSPVVGAIMGLIFAKATATPEWLVAMVGGSFAFLLQLVQVGWFFRLRGLPLWVVFVQDFLCIVLVMFAYNAPWQGGLIALLLLWLAIRSSKYWYDWYKKDRLQSRKWRKIAEDSN
jgi:Domain of unknown function (DUF4126)